MFVLVHGPSCDRKIHHGISSFILFLASQTRFYPQLHGTGFRAVEPILQALPTLLRKILGEARKRCI